MGRYRKKPVEVEAVRLGWDTWNEVCEFADVGKLTDGKPEGKYMTADGDVVDEFPGDGCRIALAIPTLEGLMIATEGDWIICGVAGELYPCKPDIFDATYEEVTD